MNWEGSAIKTLAKSKNISLQKIADEVGVSRQTVNDWTKGQIPKGNHLIILCKLLGVNPGDFFSDGINSGISVPVHRRRLSAKITGSTQNEAVKLAEEFSNIFRNYKSTTFTFVDRTREMSSGNAHKLSEYFRELSGVPQDNPVDYKHAFRLTEKLGINIIFRSFPESIKSYAFFTKIQGHRVVFVNNSTKLMDLNFQLLHESVHAIRDEIYLEEEYNQEEETYCDSIANLTQFPEFYAKMVHDNIKDLQIPQKIITLKKYALRNNHSIHGLCKAIQIYFPKFDLSVGGADNNIRKKHRSIGDIIFEGDDISSFVKRQKELNINFYNLILEQIDSISNRKLAEIYGLESVFDAKELKDEMIRDLAATGR